MTLLEFLGKSTCKPSLVSPKKPYPMCDLEARKPPKGEFDRVLLILKLYILKIFGFMTTTRKEV